MAMEKQKVERHKAEEKGYGKRLGEIERRCGVMARYIDADEALKIINNYANAIDYDCDNCKVVVDAIKDIVSIICPKADVEEVKHGDWIEKSKYGYWYYDCPYCDDGYALKERDGNKPNYCHNCGAKMDGGKEE